MTVGTVERSGREASPLMFVVHGRPPSRGKLPGPNIIEVENIVRDTKNIATKFDLLFYDRSALGRHCGVPQFGQQSLSTHLRSSMTQRSSKPELPLQITCIVTLVARHGYISSDNRRTAPLACLPDPPPPGPFPLPLPPPIWSDP